MQDTQYVYACARIRAAEGPSSARERNERIRGAKNAAELISALSDSLKQEENTDDIFTAVDIAAAQSCANAVALVMEVAPEPELLKFLLYPTDCNNIKAAVKAQLRGVPCDDILSHEGSVSAEKLADMLADRDFSALSPHMRSAVPQAIENYSKNKDPGAIDLTIDRACFEDIAEGASKTKSDVLISYAKRRADMANIMTFLRLKRINAPLELFGRAFVAGGDISNDVFLHSYDDGLDALCSALVNTGYYTALRSSQNHRLELSETERELEDFALSAFASVRYQAFGIEVLGSYLVSRFTEAKNARIMAASLAGGTISSDMQRTAHL